MSYNIMLLRMVTDSLFGDSTLVPRDQKKDIYIYLKFQYT